MALQELRADAKLLRERFAMADANGNFNAKVELADNVIPLIEGILEAMEERDAEVADLGDAVDELMDQTGDVLHQETAATIMGTLEVGKLMANQLEALLPRIDDLHKKRTRALIKGYRQGAEVVAKIIEEITLVDDEEAPEVVAAPGDPVPPDDDDDDDDGDDDDGFDDSEEE